MTDKIKDNPMNMVLVITIILLVVLPLIALMMVAAEHGDDVGEDVGWILTENVLLKYYSIVQVWAFAVIAYGVIRIGNIMKHKNNTQEEG